MHRCAIYARFSTDRQSENSAEDQVRDCRRRADREGWEVVELCTDLAISGARNRRPGMTRMLADVAEGRFDIVLVEDQDRLARDQEDIAAIFKRVTFAGARIVALSVGEINELQIGLKGTMDALELKKMAEKIRRGQRGAVERGQIPGGLCYGYDIVRELDERGELVRGKRRINPDQAGIVVRILNEYADGRSPAAIARDLNAEGIPSARGREWRVSSIVGNRGRMIGILHNPIYIGRLAYGRVRMVRDPESRNRLSRPNAKDDLVFADLPDLRIVSDDLWHRAQAARGDRAQRQVHQRNRPRHILSGLVRCGVCGSNYVVNGKDYLRCSARGTGGNCSNGVSIRISELQERVLGGLRDQLLAPEAVSLLVKEYHAARAANASADDRRRRDFARRLEQAERAVSRFVQAIADGAAYDDIRAAMATAAAERDAAREQLDEIAAVPVVALFPRIVEAYRERISNLTIPAPGQEVTASSSAGQIRELINTVYIEPGQTRRAEIHVVGSLQAAIELASNKPTQKRRGSRCSTALVAEEGRINFSYNVDIDISFFTFRGKYPHRYPRRSDAMNRCDCTTNRRKAYSLSSDNSRST